MDTEVLCIIEHIDEIERKTNKTSIDLRYIYFNNPNMRNSFNITPDRRQSKTLLTIVERGSKIARNSLFDCHLSPTRCLQTSPPIYQPGKNAQQLSVKTATSVCL